MTIAQNLRAVRSRIDAAAVRVGRDPSDIRLVAVSKQQPIDAIRAAVEAGHVDLGENYAKELAEKAATIHGVTWHFIGGLQASAAPKVAASASWVHGCVPGPALERLGRRLEAAGRKIEGLIQVDLADRGTAVAPADVLAAAAAVAELPGITLRGLMTIPPPSAAGSDARPYFQQLAALGAELQAASPQATQLSMGMSHDYEIAVEEGVTIVRVGTAVFGERPPDDPRRH